MKLHRKYERIATPLFKTIAVMFSRKEIYELPGIAEIIKKLLNFLRLTMKYTKSTNRIIAVIHILTAFLNAKLEQETKG